MENYVIIIGAMKSGTTTLFRSHPILVYPVWLTSRHAHATSMQPSLLPTNFARRKSIETQRPKRRPPPLL